uniref:zinc finger protein 40-like isoform X2 n=1 Tax=Myxine glutinosa TaxID=7769 RepID=UPI00358FCF62
MFGSPTTNRRRLVVLVKFVSEGNERARNRSVQRNPERWSETAAGRRDLHTPVTVFRGRRDRVMFDGSFQSERRLRFFSIRRLDTLGVPQRAGEPQSGTYAPVGVPRPGGLRPDQIEEAKKALQRKATRGRRAASGIQGACRRKERATSGTRKSSESAGRCKVQSLSSRVTSHKTSTVKQTQNTVTEIKQVNGKLRMDQNLHSALNPMIQGSFTEYGALLNGRSKNTCQKGCKDKCDPLETKSNRKTAFEVLLRVMEPELSGLDGGPLDCNRWRQQQQQWVHQHLGSDNDSAPASPHNSSPTTSARQENQESTGKTSKCVCHICQRVCNKPSVLEKHVRSHTGERPYPCSVCDFSFKTKSNLYKHMRSQMHKVRSLMTKECEDIDDCTVHKHHYSDDDSDEILEDSLEPETPLHLDAIQLHQDRVNSPVVSQCVEAELPSQNKLETVPMASAVFSESGKSSVDSGYLSHSESTEQATASTYSPSHKSFEDGVGTKPAVPLVTLLVPVCLSTVEKNVPTATPIHNTIGAHIDKLISLNEAVVDSRGLESVKPRRMSASRRASIDSPRPYTIQNSFQFDLPRPVSTTSVGWQVGSSLPSPDKLKSLKSQPPLLPKTTDFENSNLPLIKPSQIELGQSTTELQNKVNSLCSDGVFSGPDARNLQPRPLVRQKAVGSSEGQTDSSLRGRNKACRRRLMLECETCGVRYRKRDNYEAHKRYYCSEFSAPRQQQTKRPSDAGTPPQLGHYRVSACATLEQAPLIKRKKQNRRAVAGRSVLAETRSNPQLTIPPNVCSSLPISAGNDRGQGASARPCGIFETSQVSVCHLSPLVISEIGKGTSLLANAQLLTPDPSPPTPEHSARQWVRVMNDSRPTISRQDVYSFSVAHTPIAAVAPMSPFLDSEGMRATTGLPITEPKKCLLGFSSYAPTVKMLKTESLEQMHLAKKQKEAVFERSRSLETSPSSGRLTATKANSVDFVLGKTSAQQSGGKISVIQHTNSLSHGGSMEAIDTVHTPKTDLEKDCPPAHNQESSQENDVGYSIHSKEMMTAESVVCCQDGGHSTVNETCRTELAPKGKFPGMAEFQHGIKENYVPDVIRSPSKGTVPAKVDVSAQVALSKSPPPTCVRDAPLTVTASQTSSKETVCQTSSSHISKRSVPHKRQLLRQLSVSDEFELHDCTSLSTLTVGTFPLKNVATTDLNVQSPDVWMSDSQNQQASILCSPSWSTAAISPAIKISLPSENALFMPKYMIQLHNSSEVQVPDSCSSVPAVTLATALLTQNDATDSNAVSAPINLITSYRGQHGDQKIGLGECIPSVSTAAFSIPQTSAVATPNAPLLVVTSKPGIQNSVRELSSGNFTGDHNINPGLYPSTGPASEAFADHTDSKHSPANNMPSDVLRPLKKQSVTFQESTNQPLCTVSQTLHTLPLTGEKDCLPTLQNAGLTQPLSSTLGGNEVSFSSSTTTFTSSSADTSSSSSSTPSLTSSSFNCPATLTSSNSTPASCINSSSSVSSSKTSTSNSPMLVSAAKKRRLSYKTYGKKAEKHVVEKRTHKLSTRGKKVNGTEVTEKIERTEIVENDEAKPVKMAPKLAQDAETPRQHKGNENYSDSASSSSISTPSRGTETVDGNSTRKEALLLESVEICGENVSLPKCKLANQCEFETTQLSPGSGAAPETSCQTGTRPTGHRALSSQACTRPCEAIKVKMEESNEGSEMDEMNEPSLLDEDEENSLQTDMESLNEDLVQHAKKSVTTLQDIQGGYMSTEQYVYVRGRGRGRFVCQECGIRCHKPSMLRKHIRSHTDQRPYQCIPCSFSFKTKGNLTKHERSRAHYKQCLMKAGVDADTQEQEQSSDNGIY